MYSTYIFDLDGTLLNTLDDLALSVNYALSAHRLPTHTTDDIRRFVGNGVRKLMERAIPQGEQNPCFDAAFCTFRQHYMQHAMDHTAPYPGIEEMLSQLQRQGCRTAVVSNKFRAATQELCQHFFPRTIQVAVGEDEANGIRRKPAPDTVYEALRLLGTTTEDAVYIGDSDVDILTAKAAQMPCISVLWGFRDRQFLTEHGATTFIETPQQLLNLS